MTEPQPDFSKLNEALQKLGQGLNKVGHGLTAQAALGRIMDGNEAKARELLGQLPVDVVKLVSIAARALADLADEDVTARG